MERIEIIKESLQRNEKTLFLFNVISELSTHEWSYIYSNIDQFSGIHPYIIYSYDKNKIDDLVDLMGAVRVARVLLEAWYESTFCDDNGTPDYNSIINTPALLTIFSKHIYEIIEKSDYDVDLKEFITPKFKHIVLQFINDTIDDYESSLSLLVGKSNGLFPPIHDYKDSTLRDTADFCLMMAAIHKSISIIDTGDHLREQVASSLSIGDIDHVLDITSDSHKLIYRKKTELSEIESYLSSLNPEIFYDLHELMLDDLDVAYLKGLYARGVIGIHGDSTDLEESDAPINLGLDDGEGTNGDSILTQKKVRISANLSDKIKSRVPRIKSFFFKEKSKESAVDESKRKGEVVNSMTLESITLNKNRGIGANTIITILLVLFSAFWVFAFINSDEGNKPIIEKTGANIGSQFNIVTVHEEKK